MGTAFLWQGFDHEWLRSVLGFRLPHRISKLDSYITGEDGERAEFHFGQATGVDGNFMKPVGHFSAIRADGLAVTRGVEELRWTDEIEDGEVPCARSTLTRTISGEGVAILRGLRLQTRCDPAKQPGDQPGNSDGMWPYRFSVRFDGAELTVNIERGWTPNKGGIPGIEEKPLTRHLDFELDVAYTLLAGDEDVLAVTRADAAVAEGEARDTEHAQAVTAVNGVGDNRFPVAAVGLTGVEFELLPPTERKRHAHRGRYIGAVGFRTELAHYQPESGTATVQHRARVWVPVTVVRSQVRYQLDTALIQLAGPGAEVSPSQEVVGSLCSESSAQAPFFSHWKRCGSAKTGPAAAADQRPISAGFGDLLSRV